MGLGSCALSRFRIGARGGEIRRLGRAVSVSPAFRGRLARRGGSPREGVRSEARAEQRLAAGGAAPPTRSKCASYLSQAPPTRSSSRRGAAPNGEVRYSPLGDLADRQSAVSVCPFQRFFLTSFYPIF